MVILYIFRSFDLPLADQMLIVAIFDGISNDQMLFKPIFIYPAVFKEYLVMILVFIKPAEPIGFFISRQVPPIV